MAVAFDVAVRALHPPTAAYLGTIDVLRSGASDRGSRLSGIRDVVLHMLLGYIRDPRCGRKYFDDMLADDTRMYRKFMRRWGRPRPDGRTDIDLACVSVFPDMPIHAAGPNYTVRYKFHDGYVAFEGRGWFAVYDLTKRRGEQYRCVLRFRAHDTKYLGNNVYVCDGKIHPQLRRDEGRRSTFYRKLPRLNYYDIVCALPCGLLLERWPDGFTGTVKMYLRNYDTGEAIRVNMPDVDNRPGITAVKYFCDDYGVIHEYSGEDLYSTGMYMHFNLHCARSF